MPRLVSSQDSRSPERRRTTVDRQPDQISASFRLHRDRNTDAEAPGDHLASSSWACPRHRRHAFLTPGRNVD